MAWLQSRNRMYDLGDSIRYELYATGQDLVLASRGTEFFPPVNVEGDVYKFDVTLPKLEGGREFFVGQWGYLDNPNDEVESSTTTTTIVIPPDDHNTIQLMVFQNCSDNDGVHFRAEVIRPDNLTYAYNFEVINTNPNDGAAVEKTGHNTWVIRNHDDKKNGSFKVIVTRNGCKSCTYESYSSTCNHDGQPTDCPHNDRVLDVVGGNRLLKAGNIIEFGINNALPCSVVYYNTNVSMLDERRARIDGFPFKLHSQPNCGGGCHGWTEIYQETE